VLLVPGFFLQLFLGLFHFAAGGLLLRLAEVRPDGGPEEVPENEQRPHENEKEQHVAEQFLVAVAVSGGTAFDHERRQEEKRQGILQNDCQRVVVGATERFLRYYMREKGINDEVENNNIDS